MNPHEQAIGPPGCDSVHNLRLLLHRLAEAGFGFVVVGGYASVLHGSSFVTDNLDVCTSLSPESIAILREVLADLHPKYRTTDEQGSFVKPAPEPLWADRLSLVTDAGVVVVRSSVPGVGDYEHLRKTAFEIPFFGRRCAVISLEDLIAAKQAVGREKDLLAVKELRAIAAKRALG